LPFAVQSSNNNNITKWFPGSGVGIELSFVVGEDWRRTYGDSMGMWLGAQGIGARLRGLHIIQLKSHSH